MPRGVHVNPCDVKTPTHNVQPIPHCELITGTAQTKIAEKKTGKVIKCIWPTNDDVTLVTFDGEIVRLIEIQAFYF